MAGESGKDGKVMVGAATLAEITHWTISKTSNNPAWSSSSSAGEKTRVAGVKDSTGTVDFMYDSSDRIPGTTIDSGLAVTLLLYINATDYYNVPAIIDEVSNDVDINDGGVVSGSFTWGQTGAITNPT